MLCVTSNRIYCEVILASQHGLAPDLGCAHGHVVAAGPGYPGYAAVPKTQEP